MALIPMLDLHVRSSWKYPRMSLHQWMLTTNFTLRSREDAYILISSGIVSEEHPWSRHAGKRSHPYGTFYVYPQSKSPSWSVELDVEEL